MSDTSEPLKMSFWQALLSKKMLICLFNGASAGLPLFFLGPYLNYWLATQGTNNQDIGLFAFVQLPYAIKFFWAPLMDSIELPFLGLRRGWMLVTQLACMTSMLSLAFCDPQAHLAMVALASLSIAFFSASQDIVLDAYRRELLDDRELGLGNSMYMNGYRISGFIPGGLGLILADFLNWSVVHMIIGSFMLIGVIKTLLVPEVSDPNRKRLTFTEAVVGPFQEFFRRDGVKSATLTLSFIILYKLGDSMATALSTPFFNDLGFTGVALGTVYKLCSFWATFIGAFIGGVVIFKVGINRSLWYFSVVQLVSILGFAVLSEVGNSLPTLAFVVSFEYLGVGLGASALVAFMSRATSKQFTATQFALLSGLVAIPRVFVNATTGFLVSGVTEAYPFLHGITGDLPGLGWTHFFILCTFLALPGMALLPWVAPWTEKGYNKVT